MRGNKLRRFDKQLADHDDVVNINWQDALFHGKADSYANNSSLHSAY